VAIIASEEEVHVLTISDESLVDRTTASGDGTGEERLGSGPTVGIARIGRGVIGESGRTPLMGKDPGAFWSEVKDGRGNGRRRHLRLSGGPQTIEC